jgi:membrane protein required for colicin V production
MNFIDIIIIVFLGYAGWKGLKHGLIIEVFTLLALVVGLYAGIHFSDFIAERLKVVFGLTSKYLPVIAFTITFLGVGAMVYFAGKAIEKLVKAIQLSPINKAFGLVFSVLKMAYILSIVLVLVESYDEKNNFFPKETKDNSLLYEPVKKVSTLTIPGLEESRIFLKNAFQEESDSTGLTVDQIIQAKRTADSLGLDANDAKQIIEVHEKYGKK